MRPITLTCGSALLVLVVGCGATEQGPSADGGPQKMSLKSAVTEAYRKVSHYTTMTNRLEVILSEMTDVEPISIATRKVSDLLPRVPDRIVLSSVVYQDKNAETGTVSQAFAFQARWNVDEPSPLEWDSMTFAEAIDSGAEMPPLDTIQEMVSFKVTVGLDSKNLTYHSFAFRTPDAAVAAGAPAFTFMDQLLGPSVLARALSETLPVRSDVIPMGVEGDCAAHTTSSEPQPLAWEDTSDHECWGCSGSHHASSTVAIDCIYNADCSNQCAPSIVSTGGENGFTFMYIFHEYAQDIQQLGGFAGPGADSSCKVGYGAGVRLCLLPCGVVVKLAINGLGVFEYSQDSNAEVTASINQIAGNCPAQP